jgi:hypothetical protein
MFIDKSLTKYFYFRKIIFRRCFPVLTKEDRNYDDLKSATYFYVRHLTILFAPRYESIST